MSQNYRVLAINPGSTSTKIGVFEGEKLVYEGVVRHTAEEIAAWGGVIAQAPMRMKLIKDLLAKENIDLATMDAFVGRGGIVRPLKSGVYTINEKLLDDLYHLPSASRHASALGGIFAHELGEEYGKPCFIADPVVVDERNDIARVTGLPDVERTCVFHCLNIKATARKYCKEHEKDYNNTNLIVAHMGGGISVAASEKGVVIDVNDAIAGEGPFSPERTGSIHMKLVLDMCFSGDYTKEQLYGFCSKTGGFVAHMGTNSALDVENAMLAGDEKAKMVFEALGYNVAKTIGEMATVLKGNVEAILLTGGLAYSKPLCKYISDMVSFIAPICVYPGESELDALAGSAIRVLSGEEDAKEYLG